MELNCYKIIYMEGRKKRELTIFAESEGQAVYFAQLGFRIDFKSKPIKEVIKLD